MVILMIAALRDAARLDEVPPGAGVVRRGGRWLVDARQAAPGGPGYTPDPRVNRALARAAAETAAEVEAGKFADPGAAADAFRHRAMVEALRDVVPGLAPEGAAPGGGGS
jgi:hypothetical protein